MRIVFMRGSPLLCLAILLRPRSHFACGKCVPALLAHAPCCSSALSVSWCAATYRLPNISAPPPTSSLLHRCSSFLIGVCSRVPFWCFYCDFEVRFLCARRRQRSGAIMSWQSYVDDHLMYEISAGHSLAAAAIIGHDGNVWAQSATFPELKPGEVEKLVAGFEENSTLAQNGLFLGGAKYMVLQGDPGIVIRGKKGPGGCCVRKTNSALVIGLYDDPCTPGECNIAVEKLGEYLFDQGI